MKQAAITETDFISLSRMIRHLEFFSNLTVADLDAVMRHIGLYEYGKGERVFKEGQPADALYIVYEGTLVVKKNRSLFLPSKKISLLTSGQMFGEMALLNQSSRTATVQALTAAKVFVLLSTDFNLLCQQNSTFSREMKALSERRSFENQHT